MLYIDDARLPDRFDNVEILHRFGRRPITHAFHDVDGTHSLIRNWPPVMGATLHSVISSGLPEGYDSEESARRLVAEVDKGSSEETDRFCIESAGLSALTQMEWAIRRAIEAGTILPERVDLDAGARETNSSIIRSIWQGREVFDDVAEPPKLKRLLREHTPRLFRLYEKVLNGACRDANLAAARLDPGPWRVSGSLEFLRMLHRAGVKNYFITGAVIDRNERGEPERGMYEEVLALGFDIGPGCTIEGVHGSTWDRKVPKSQVMQDICRRHGVEPRGVLVVGDGRSEIAAGVTIGAVTVSRLPEDAARRREIHRGLGTHVMLTDFTSPRLRQLFHGG